MTITNLHYQRAKPSPLWSKLCPGVRIGGGSARIARVLCGKAPCGADPDRTAGRGAAREGGMVERATPFFRRWCATGQGEMVHAKIHHLPSPSGVALSTVIPGGKAIELMRKPESAILPGHCRIGRNGRHRGCQFRLDFGRRTSIRRAGHRPETVTHRIRYLISGDRHRRSLRVWQTHYSRVFTESAGENSSPTISNTTWANHKGEGISHKVVCYREKGLSDHVRGRSTRFR